MTPSELRAATRRFNAERRRNIAADADLMALVAIHAAGLVVVALLLGALT